MAQATALRRLRREYDEIRKNCIFPGIFVEPLETNFLHAHFLLSGVCFEETVYEGGVYHGVLKFPPTYPLKPPSVLFRTPSGRFAPDTKICFSMSDFHPELWSPSWSIRTILTGLVSFMNTEEITTGGLTATPAYRIQAAKASLKYCCEKDPIAKDLFGDTLEKIQQDRSNLGNRWPPRRMEVEVVSVIVEEAARPTRRELAKARAARRKPSTTTEETDDDETELDNQNGEPQQTGNKNAAKNKKKRDKEKRKKLAQHFLERLRCQVPEFLDRIAADLEGMGVSGYLDCTPDHVCWRTETLEEYSNLVAALRASEQLCNLLVESEIGGRQIATFELKEGIPVLESKHSITVVEIPAPKEGSPYATGLEHVEFVLPTDLESIKPVNDETHRFQLQRWMEKHPNLDWSTKAMDKSINPDISLKLDSVGSVKFHLVPLAQVIEYEKSL